MTFFVRNGNNFSVTADGGIDIHDTLPAGNYIVKFNEMTNTFYLERVEKFESIGKVYGDSLRNADRIISTFLDRTASTGVMLTGEKGSGKTLLARTLSIKLAEQDIPTIVINEAYSGDGFNRFLQAISQPAVVLFDEFEKTYDKDDQEAVLTLLDGVFPQKKLFILTCNDKYRVDSHMRNRPGRIFYMLEFAGLAKEFVIEYCQDRLHDKGQIDSVVNVSLLFSEFNFDMLKALVEEMNRFKEPAHEAIKMLNAKPTWDDSGNYDIVVQDPKGKVLPMNEHTWSGNPLKRSEFNFWTNFPGDKNDRCVRFSIADLLKVDPETESVVFVTKTKDVVTFKRKKLAGFSYDMVF